jgi:CubicO group peptidase (beta-lactamase class C family)
MSWSEDTARSLAETFADSFSAPGVVIAAACIDEAGPVSMASPGDSPADGSFEIGSVTKTMTATLVALQAADGQLLLDDEIGRWLSAGPNGGITVRQLATHTSGLPRLPPNLDLRTADPANPWAGFSFERAEEGLREAVVDPAAPWLYSNFGYQLLALVLERASGYPFEKLMTDQLLIPVGMTCSGVENSGNGISLPGHAGESEVPRWDHPLGAGGVEATIGDLARYAEACLHPPQTSLGAAIITAQTPQFELGDNRYQALAWQVREDGIRVHDGGTGGFSSAVLIDPGRDRAVAMLASYGGYAQVLGHAGLLALAGDDPRQARPQPPGPEWDDRAREVIQSLLDGRTEDVHARASTAFQSAISVEQLDRAWRNTNRDLGGVAEVLVSCGRPAGHVVADVRVSFENGTVALRISFESSGTIAGLRFMPPQEAQSVLPE